MKKYKKNLIKNISFKEYTQNNELFELLYTKLIKIL